MSAPLECILCGALVDPDSAVPTYDPLPDRVEWTCRVCAGPQFRIEYRPLPHERVAWLCGVGTVDVGGVTMRVRREDGRLWYDAEDVARWFGLGAP